MENTTTIPPKPAGRGWVWDDDLHRWFRIRKLTTRECFRLMGVRDADIDKIESAKFVAGSANFLGYGKKLWYGTQKGNKVFRKLGAPIADSQQYSMAGNSIVVDCLAAIFEQLLFPQPQVPSPEEIERVKKLSE